MSRTSKTFTTHSGAKATTSASKDYMVVGEITRSAPVTAVVLLRTNDLPTAVKRQRREIRRLDTPYGFIQVFRKSDGASYNERTGQWHAPVPNGGR